MPKKRIFLMGILALIIILLWLGTTAHPRVWPVRNVLLYRVMMRWQSTPTAETATGALAGLVTDDDRQPVADAWVLVSRWDGQTYRARSNADGTFRIEGVPAGRYRPAAAAPGFENQISAAVAIRDGQATNQNIALMPAQIRAVTPGQNLTLGEPATRTCQNPIESRAVRRTVTFDNAGRPNQTTFLYTPVEAAADLPILLAVYPGPAEGWECASLPLAQAGYATLGIGPAYSFDLDTDIDELERLVDFARRGRFPGTDGARIALLGGSYSGLHVQRMLQRDPDFVAAVLLGPPTDLFEMRRQLESGEYIPPYGLDQALIALGLPHRQPGRYWQYSGAYHVQPDFPPILLLHSRSDAVVPWQQSELLARELARLDVPHETHFFEGASHYLLDESGQADTVKIYEFTLNFLDQRMSE